MISEDKKSELMDAIILSELYKTNNRANSFGMAVDLLNAIIKIVDKIDMESISKIDNKQEQKIRSIIRNIILDYTHKGHSIEGFTDELREETIDSILFELNESIMFLKVNGEYQCSHVKENIIKGDCVYCNLTIVEQGLEKQKQKAEELQTVLDAWFEVFGTTQLTHASERLRIAEEKAFKFDNINQLGPR